MAINKSNKGPMNGGGDGIDNDPLHAAIERVGNKFAKTTNEVDQLGRKMNSLLRQRADLSEAQSKDKTVSQAPWTTDQFNRIDQEIAKAQASMNSHDANRNAAATQEVSNIITKQFSKSSINSAVNEMRGNADVQSRAYAMIYLPNSELKQQQALARGALNMRERASQGYVGQMFSDGGRTVNSEAQLKAQSQWTQGSKDSIATLAASESALQIQRDMGLDPISRERKTAKQIGYANSLLGNRDLDKEIKSGSISIMDGGKARSVKNKDLDSEVFIQSQKLADQLKDLAAAVKAGKENLDDYNEKIDETADGLEKMNSARERGAGDGRNNMIGNLNAFGAGFNALGGAVSTIFGAHRQQEISNIGGYANIANNQYDLYRQGRGGNVAASLSLLGANESENFSEEQKSAVKMANGAYMFGAAAQGVAGLMTASEAGAQKGNPGAYLTGSSTANTEALQKGILGAFHGGLNELTIISDSNKKATENATGISSYHTFQQARAAVNHIGAEQVQGLRDYYTGLDVVGQSMGTNASSFIEDSGSDANLKKMIEARMSPEQYNQAAQEGIDGQGSVFKKDSIYKMQELQKFGFGNVSQNNQRAGMLASAGANNPAGSLETLIALGTQKGLDNSKAIGMMVEYTSSMASSSGGAGLGVDTTKAYSSMLAETMSPNISNRESALSQAMTAAQLTQSITTNKDVSYQGMFNTQGIEQALGAAGFDVDLGDAGILQGMSAGVLKSLKGDSAKAANIISGKGLKGVNVDNVQKMLDVLLDQKSTQVLRGGSLAAGFDPGEIAELAKMDPKLLTADQLHKLGRSASFSNFTGAEEGAAQVRSITSPVNESKLELKNNKKTETNDLRTSGYQQLSQAAAHASKELGGFTKAMEALTALQMKLEKGGMGNEKAFSTAAKDMATSFTASTVKFDSAVGKLEGAAAMLVVAANLTSNGSAVIPEWVTAAKKRLNQLKSGKTTE